MPSLVEKPKLKLRRQSIKREPWWGSGSAPHIRWAGATIQIPAIWSSRKKRWETQDGKYYFDPAAANYASEFFPTFLRHHMGRFNNKPFELLDYQRYVVRTAWGWKHTEDGDKKDLRRFEKIFIAVPKGNGKSPLCSGLGLLLAFFDHEPGAEVYAVAADKKQARIVFDTSKVMVDKSEILRDLCEPFTDSIKLKGSIESFQVLSSEASTKHGFRPHGIIFDEFHAQPNRDLFDTLYRNLGKRSQPMLVMITTAGDDDESICFEEWDYARRVITGSITDENYLPLVFEAKPEEDWTQPEVWKRVNPGYGITIRSDYLENECRLAQSEPRKRNSFLQLHLNRWVNQAVAWLPIEWWDSCPSALPSDDVLKGLQCSAGLDGAQKIDLFSMVLSFREPLVSVEMEAPADIVEVVGEDALNYRIYLLPLFWIPENTLKQHEKEDKVPYSQWIEKGWVKKTEGDVIDYDQIFKDILALAERFPRLKEAEIGYDPAFVTELAQKLIAKGFKMVEVLQNYKYMSEPCQVMEALLKAGRVTHDGNRCMRRCIENVAIKTDDARRIRPVKPKKASKRIDGVVAWAMGQSRLMVMPEDTGSVWDDPNYSPLSL